MESVIDLAIHYNDEGVAIIESGQKVWIEPKNLTKIFAIGGHAARKFCVAWSKNGKTMVVRDDDGKIGI